MVRFFEGINSSCEYFNGGCTHKKNTKGNSCSAGYCSLLIEAGLVTIEGTKKTEFITNMFNEIFHDLSDGIGINNFKMVIRAMLLNKYKIVDTKIKNNNSIS